MLTSRLLRDEPRLIACSVQDRAHVFEGVIGNHVARIQLALLLIDGYEIDATELARARYGPSTAAAVLAFKTQRQIINYRYQSQPDAIVGKMTIAALDRELLTKER